LAIIMPIWAEDWISDFSVDLKGIFS